jgi:NhaA family Na+:H+ antiporter
MKNQNFLQRYLQLEAASGVVMLLCAALAIILANFAADFYSAIIHAQIGLQLGAAELHFSLQHMVNDCLMVLFFLAVGLELKREFKVGFLAEPKQIKLPLIAAFFGMLLPAIIFIAITGGDAKYIAGWAIASATDIAFALCVLTIIGRNIPPAIKILLLAIAIFDDLGAILIIAFGYSEHIALLPLLLVALGMAGLWLLNRLHISHILPYLLLGIYLASCLAAAGIHTTLAGVMVGLALPMYSDNKHKYSPVNSLLKRLHKWVNFGVLPLFAFTAAGVNFTVIYSADLLGKLPLAVAAALFFGKQIGVFGACFVAIKTGFAAMPKAATWRHIYGVAVLCGVGFTMSLFIGALAYSSTELQNQVKIGVLAGSLLSSILGAVILRRKIN